MERKGFNERLKAIFKPHNEYCSEVLMLFCMMLIIRIAEGIALFITDYQSEIIINCLIGFFTDIAYTGWIVVLLFLLYSALNLLSLTAANIVIRFIFGAYICMSMLLTGYFAVTHIPLDGIITGYSPKELYVTIKANGSYNIPIIIGIIIISIAFTAIPRKKVCIPKWIKITMLAILTCCIFFPGLDREKFRYEREYYIVENKTVYLLNCLKDNSSTIQFTANELKEKSEEFASYFPNYEFVDYHYPFMHKDETPDILTNYLAKSEDKPNIVIIIVEGLCNYISGKNSTIASATPFLDSLSEHSLVWENCLSTSERTFGALPSILGALPFGENGFMSYRRDVPNFNTLATILHDNGYKNTFFYGGWYGFDDMDIFAQNNSMKMFYDSPEYESVEQRNTWGLLDGYMLSHSLTDVKNDDKPRLDIYLTLSTHDPFSYPNTDEYISKYNALPQKGKSTTPIKENASFMYADDCLKTFFKEYEQCEQFDRTIFVITGDHKFNTKDRSNVIDNYHVPLIIWSPMLKDCKRFSPIVTHRSIAPSILAYMKHTCGIIVPQDVAWLNSGLDTSSNFTSKTFAPHFGEDRKLKAITFDDYFITKDKTFKLDNSNNNLSLIPTDNNENAMLIDIYQALERYIMNNDALVPNEK